MEKKLNIWNDYQNQKNYDLSFKTVDDNAPDNIVLTETKDDRGKNGEQWNFKIVSKDYIDTKNAEQDETARQQQTQITEHSHTLREHEEKIVKIEEKNTEQDGKLLELENKNTEQDGKLSEIENKNTEQDGKLTEHENRLEQLDGGHSSNLGKIGEIEEQALKDRKILLQLKSLSDTRFLLGFRQVLNEPQLKKKNSIVKIRLNIKAKDTTVENSNIIYDNPITFTGLYTVDKNNNNNDILNLLGDTNNSNWFPYAKITNDYKPTLDLIYVKQYQIVGVEVEDFSQIFLENENDFDEDLLKVAYGLTGSYGNGAISRRFIRSEIVKLNNEKCLVSGTIEIFITTKENTTNKSNIEIFGSLKEIYPKKALDFLSEKKISINTSDNFPRIMFYGENGEYYYIDSNNRDFGNVILDDTNSILNIPIDYTKTSHHFKIFFRTELGENPDTL